MNVLSIPLNLSLFSFSGCVHAELLRKLFGSSPPPLIYFIYITEIKQGLPLSIAVRHKNPFVLFFLLIRQESLHFILSEVCDGELWANLPGTVWLTRYESSCGLFLCFCHDINIESLWFAIKWWCMVLTYVRFELSWKSDSIWVMIFTFWSTLLLLLSVF